MMGRGRRGRKINGWLALDKPVGMTSNAALGRARRFLDAAKAGHGGTLDPLASGVLPIALGQATRTVSLIMNATKTYVFTARWGEERESDDAEGIVLARTNVRPTAADIESCLGAFTGDIEQIPPRVSAIKVGGRRAYDLVREGQPVALTPRRVRIERFELVDCPDCDHARFRVVCGKGSYIRALVRDLGQRLGTLGHVVALRRTRVGPFGEDAAISLDSLQELGHSQSARDSIQPVEAVLQDIPVLSVAPGPAALLRNGRAVALFHTMPHHPATASHTLETVALETVKDVGDGDETVAVTCRGSLVALVKVSQGRVRPVRVFSG